MPLRTCTCASCHHKQEEIVPHNRQTDEDGYLLERPCEGCGEQNLQIMTGIELGSFACKGPGWFKSGGY
jgi:Zn finger protein HypA/HybF involved in hydrogenase expression